MAQNGRGGWPLHACPPKDAAVTLARQWRACRRPATCRPPRHCRRHPRRRCDGRGAAAPTETHVSPVAASVVLRRPWQSRPPARAEASWRQRVIHTRRLRRWDGRPVASPPRAVALSAALTARTGGTAVPSTAAAGATRGVGSPLKRVHSTAGATSLRVLATRGRVHRLTDAGGRRADGPRAGAQRRSERSASGWTRRWRRPPRRAASFKECQASGGRQATGGPSRRRRRRRHGPGVGASCRDPSAVGLRGGGRGEGGGQRQGWWEMGRPRCADGRGAVSGAVHGDARGAGGLSAPNRHTCF